MEQDKTMSQEIKEIKFACFSLGTCLFCVDIMRIKEILPFQRLDSIPAPSWYLNGAINHRGRVIPVMNLKKRFGMLSIDSDSFESIIIVRLPQRQLLALAVDEIHEVITVPVEKIVPVPEIENSAGADCILGVAVSADSFHIILGIDALLAPVELESLTNFT
jgi:purine-binding chemotaxis protein CheW